MNAHVMDSGLYKDLFSDGDTRECFSDKQLLKHWIDIEVALAQAQAELGIIPKEAFEEIKHKGKVHLFDMSVIRQGIKNTSHPLIPFIRMFEENCEDGHGEYIHFGVTTQDITDTGFILQLKEGYHHILNQVETFIEVLKEKTIETRDLPMAGRTHGQHALPITLGFKLATWLSEMERNRIRLHELYKRVFVGQLGGAVGTLASLGKDGFAVQERVMEILGLETSPITWHSSRDNFVELASVYGMVAGTIGKIANEIINLQRTEIAEIEEGFANGKVGSSTMPHKRNPMICEYIVGLSKLVRMQMSSAYETLVQEHERDMGLWLLEWELWPELSIYTSKILKEMTQVISYMIINPDNMKRNLHLTDGLILSEHLMFQLSPHIGKQTAHDIVYQVCMEAFESRKSVTDAFLENKTVCQYLSNEEIIAALQPENYLGQSKAFVDRVLKQIDK